jgi:nicotinamide riboside kinase
MEEIMRSLKSFAITGPESTGKSALAQTLATHYQTAFLPEFARTYLEENGPKYTYETVVYMAEQQLLQQTNFLKQAPSPCFFDTDLMVCRIWLEFVFGKCPSHILRASKEALFTHTLLMDIDLPWQEDPLREHPAQRKELFELYQNSLELARRPFTIISGIGDLRVQAAREVVESFMKG